MINIREYIEKEHTKLFERLGVFFAFSDEQFKEGCKKVGANKDNKVTSIGHGGFVLSKNKDIFIVELKSISKKSIEKDIKENGMKNIIWRELSNYEAQISNDIDDTVEALEHYGITREEIEKEYKNYFEHCVENDLF